jgi:hypothetical protein
VARVLSLILLAFSITAVLGCGPKVAREELGHVVFEVPKVPGSDKPFEMPQLQESPPIGDSQGADATQEKPAPHSDQRR